MPPQPWDPLLADNLLFAKALPLIVGFGIFTGLIRSIVYRGLTLERRRDGAIRRFAVGTVFAHWFNATGFLLALTTGSLQYLKGVLDVSPPLPLDLLYRLHYIGAAILVLSAAHFLTYRVLIPDRPLLPSRNRLRVQLRGLIAELPQPVGAGVARLLQIDIAQPAPAAGQFTYYERVFSFPVWSVLLGLIVITGLLKALRYVYPIPGPALWLASFTHVGAMVLLAAKLLDHLRYVLAPARWPVLVSMVTTWMDGRYARERHPEWVREVEEEASS